MAPLNTELVEETLRRGDYASLAELGSLLHLVPGEDGGLRAAWLRGLTGPDRESALAELASLLVERSGRSTEFAVALVRWLADSEGRAERPAGPMNSIGGTADVAGGVVQAREIHGGVHFRVLAPAQLPIPQQLPPAPARLLGRSRDLAALDATLDDRSRAGGLTVVLSGLAGVGKSALAGNWLRGLSGRFPDGLLYADLRAHAPDGPAEVTEVLAGFLRALGVDSVPAVLAETVALWRSTVARRRIGLLLDSALSAAQVRPLLPGTECSLVVVTSRARLTGLGIDGARFHPVGPLDRESAAAILSARIGADRVAAEQSAADQVIARCAGLPLAVCLAGARMAARPNQALSVTADALASEARRLDTLRIDGETAVRGVLDASCRVLAEDTARLYRLLGALPLPDITPGVAGAAAAVRVAEADRLLDGLAEVHLLEDRGEGRYRFHDLVRLHARDWATEDEPADLVRAARRRVLDWYLAAATGAEALISPSHRTLARDYLEPPSGLPSFADESEALAWLDTERAHLMAVLRAGAAAGEHTAVWQLADAMWPLFLRLRPHDLWVEAHELGLVAARDAGDAAGELRMLTSGGHGLRNAGRPLEAADWFADALALAREAGDPRAEADAHFGLGHAHQAAGRLDHAAESFRRSLRLREGIGYPRGAALARIALGEAMLAAGSYPAAEELLTRAHRELTALPDRYEAARALAWLGRTHAAADRAGAAEECFEAALAEFRHVGSRHWEARVLELLGELEQGRNRPTEALNRYGQSLAVYRGLGAPDADRLVGRIDALSRG
ncbi:tetratricopeptide repeat protein [Streptomyces sp. FH025]|uniref:ATP-binding protein n=1 Tax=Streptomyces sp. FH025 TaxID=2815937 RepID=UPI001A9E39D9|nr:tetratricopeptide repeat protein [Streptomyces sp. FH025]MBO1414217.1 tetratricopeptide repeat protein [Streptomyces sp. FH025]